MNYNVDDVMKLVNAGFSKGEIERLLSTPKAKDTPEDEPEATPEATPEVNPEATPEATPEVNPAQPDFAVMTEGISKAIIEALQKQNILNSNQKDEDIPTGEDILATVLDLYDEK